MDIYMGTFSKEPHSPKQPVRVQLEPEGLRLHLEESGTMAFLWPAAQIHPHAYRKGELTVLQFGQGQVQTLEVVSPTFAQAIKETYPEAVFHRNALPEAKGNRSALYLLVLLLVGGLLACYFFLLPALADFMVRQLPKQAEVKLGEQLLRQMVKPATIDSAATVKANQFLQQLKLSSAYPLRVTVVKQETVNAFALPGGQLVIYTGLLHQMETPEELAALLGHEFTHSQNRHSLRALARSMSTYLLVSLIFSDVGGLAAVLLENADQFDSLSYSRSLEEEADEQAFFLLKENQLSPRGMEDLLKRLQSATPKGAEPPAFLSTHPLTGERLVHLRELVQENPYSSVQNRQLNQLWAQMEGAR